ncbi:MAG: PTS sugar transporter subunit IIC [Brevinema sp.]
MSFEEKFLTVANTFSNQRHINAIRASFYKLMPLILIASLYVLINNVLFNLPFFAENSFIQSLKDVGDRVFRGTLGIMSLLSAFITAYYLAESYKEEAIFYGATALGCLIAMLPGLQEINGGGAWGVLVFSDTSASGLFTAILIAILSTELLRFFSSKKALLITLPDSVPPAVAKSFSALIPILLTFTTFSLFAYSLNQGGMTLSGIITTTIQTPLVNALQNPIGIIAILGIQNLLWGFGLHGSFVLGPITEPTLLIAIQNNIDAIQAGMQPMHIVTKPFLDAFANVGGSGATFSLILALLIFSKREDEKLIGKLSLTPGLFNINEPLIFGLPIVLNPVYIVPFIIAPIVSTLIAYFATAAGLINKTIVLVPWTTPPILSAYLATGNDIRAAILSFVLIIISTMIFAPFVIISNKMLKK